MNLFQNNYRNKKVFVTGHTGFKGSWLVFWLKQLGAKVYGYSLTPNTTPNHYSLLNPEKNKESIANILEKEKLLKAMQKFAPDFVFHLAAQPLVRYSYQEPEETWATNVLGSLNIYETVRKTPSVKVLVTITTDKVYENNEWPWGYRENDRLGGHDPYSASKAAMEILTASYRKSFFNHKADGNNSCQVAVVRAGNVIGGGDWAVDRLIPDLIKTTQSKKPISIRSPKAVRPWQHVLEPLSGYLHVGSLLWSDYTKKKDSKYADAFNFGPYLHEKLEVENVAKIAKKIWPEINYQIKEDKNSPHEAGLLQLDISKATKALGWKPLWRTDEGIQITIDWYKQYVAKGKVNTLADLNNYVALAKKQNQPWASK